MPSPKTTEAARLQNDFGADYWVRNPDKEHRVRISFHSYKFQFILHITKNIGWDFFGKGLY